MRKDFFPDAEPEQLSWSGHFAARLVSDPEGCGVSVEQAAWFAELQADFAEAYRRANDPATRTRVAVLRKAEAGRSMERAARALNRVIQSSPNVTAVRKCELGLSTAPRGRGPRLPAPSDAPLVRMRDVTGQTLTLQLVDADSPYRSAKPYGVDAAVISLHVGPDAPADADQWRYAGQASRTTAVVDVPGPLPAGTVVWVTARWFNRRGMGPMATPAYAYLKQAMPKLDGLRAA